MKLTINNQNCNTFQMTCKTFTKKLEGINNWGFSLTIVNRDIARMAPNSL